MPRYKFPKNNKINLGRKHTKEQKDKQSETLRRLWEEGKIKGSTGKSWKKGKNINCIICRKPFYIFKKSKKRFCSFRCKHEGMKGCIPWNKELKGLQPWHNITGFKSRKGCKLPKSHPFCQIGKNHLRWVNGNYKKQYKRNDSAYQNWVKQVKKRDNNTCIINNKDCSGYCIVHHILPMRDYPELTYKINNGITLCQAHHPRKRAEEKRLIPFFQGLVSVSS